MADDPISRGGDKTCMSHWWPKLLASGGDIPMPKTEMLVMPPAAQIAAFDVFDGNQPGPAFGAFVRTVADAADRIGYPCFLRTGHTSGKHEWSRACHVPSRGDIAGHVLRIIEYSEMAGFPGLPVDHWAVREMLPAKTFGTCPKFGGMPIAREFRVFVDGVNATCWHPYWPLGALKQGGAEAVDYHNLCHLHNPRPVLDIATMAGKLLGGAWSVDVMDTCNGWFLIDMAEADKSFHWPDCPSIEAADIAATSSRRRTEGGA